MRLQNDFTRACTATYIGTILFRNAVLMSDYNLTLHKYLLSLHTLALSLHFHFCAVITPCYRH